MPVLKIKNNGVWEQVGGIPDHTHVIDDITDFPTSLPANGGNADTVDGKHASDFASAAEMTTVQNDINDINTMLNGIEIPTELPNPNALRFTGAVNASYDGSSEVNVEIPDISGKMDKNNPTGTGSFSLNRKAGTTIGLRSHAEGYNTEASAEGSHAEGSDTKASSACQHVQGKFNIEDSSDVYADIIGNGTSDDDRSNAATVDWSGNAWYAGDVYVGSTSGTNKDEGSKKLATEEYVDNSTASIDIPTTLPNPQSLTFTGAVEGTYDGSSALAVEIPSTPEIPTQLPNPQSLTFTGAVTGSYDGSVPLTVEIPSGDSIVPVPSSADNGKYLGCKNGAATWMPVEASGGGDISLGLTAASVGQTIKVKAVDENGKPTEWEAADLVSGGDKWELINEFTIPEGAEESNSLSLTKDSNGNDFVLKKALLLSNFPPYTGESTIPNFSFASINGIMSGSSALVPNAYTSAWPTVSKTSDRGGAYFVDVSGIFQIEKALKTDTSKLKSNGTRLFTNTNSTNNIDKEWMAIPNSIGEIHEIGGRGMLIYPSCWFALYGVRA